MTKFPPLPAVIEFPASAQTMVGNNNGACLLHLTGAAITVKFKHTKESPSWPYNCIRQFRADEETKQFSFYSGRRGPYGVAEYKFDMTDEMLLALQDALTQFTGAQFGGANNSTGGGGSISSSVGISMTSPGIERYAPDVFRSPKHDPLPQIPGTPPGNSNMQPSYMTHIATATLNHKHSATDVFATLSKDQRYRQTNPAMQPGRPLVPAPYHAHTLDMRAKQGPPFINTKYLYHDVTGSAAPPVPAGPGGWNFGSPAYTLRAGVGGMGPRKMSHGEDVFCTNTSMSPVRTAKLARQATAPTHRVKHSFEVTDSPHQEAVTAANGDDGTSDLDFGPLRRRSPQVDRKNTRRGHTSPTNGHAPSPHHDHYNVPRSSGSSPPTGEGTYNVPRPHSSGEPLSLESGDVPSTVAVSPTEGEGTYNVPKPVGNGAGSETIRTQLQQRQLSTEEAATVPADVGGTVIYNVPPAMHGRQMVRPPDDGHELYNTPKVSVANGHELYNTPKQAVSVSSGAPPPVSPEGGPGVYNVPRAALDSYTQQQEDDGLYKVPRSLEDTSETTYNVPRSSQKPANYDSLQTVFNNTGGDNDRGTPSAHFQISSRQPMPLPDQDPYNMPRPSSSFSPTSGRRGRGGEEGQRYPYDYVDHTLPRGANGVLKSSRSLESLVRNRVTLSPEAPSQTQTAHAHRTPSPRAREHKYIEIDVDEFPPSPDRKEQQKRKGENFYAEISDTHPGHQHTPHRYSTTPPETNHYTIVPSNLPTSAVNSTPMPSQSGHALLGQSNGDTNSASKEARALHEEEGYELVLPAEAVARNVTLQQQRQIATQPWNMQRAYSVSQGQRAQQAQFSTSGPVDGSGCIDQYVIVNRRDVNQPTQPRDIPAPVTTENNGVINPPSVPVSEEQYEVMTSVKKQVAGVDKSTGGQKGAQFTMVPVVPAKKRGSTSSKSASFPRSDVNGQHSVRDSLDLESVETGSRTSVASSGHLDDLIGPLSPVDSGVHSITSYPPGVPTGKKNVIRIASGSPHDVSPSKDLKLRSNSVENILDEDKKHKYENITDKDLAAKHALSASTLVAGGPKKPPMPLPRPTRP